MLAHLFSKGGCPQEGPGREGRAVGSDRGGGPVPTGGIAQGPCQAAVQLGAAATGGHLRGPGSSPWAASGRCEPQGSSLPEPVFLPLALRGWGVRLPLRPVGNMAIAAAVPRRRPRAQPSGASSAGPGKLDGRLGAAGRGRARGGPCGARGGARAGPGNLDSGRRVQRP